MKHREFALNLNVSKSDVIEMNMRLTGSDVALIGDGDSESSPINWLSDNSSSPENMLERKAHSTAFTNPILLHGFDALRPTQAIKAI